MSLMLEPDSRPRPSHSEAPAVACASAIGREVCASVSAVSRVATACILGSEWRFNGFGEFPTPSCDPGMVVPSSVLWRDLSENGMTRRCSCSKGPFKWEGGTTPTYVANVPAPTWTCNVPPSPPTLAPNVPTSGGGGDLRPRRTSQRQVATSNVNVVRGTSLDTPGRARTSLGE